MDNINYRELYQNDSLHSKLYRTFGHEHPGSIFTSFCIYCNDDGAWKSLFGREGIDYTELDAPNVAYRDLMGTSRAPYSMPTFFEPDWLKDVKKTRVLVINNLEQVPFESDDVFENERNYAMCEDLYLVHRPKQLDFAGLLRRPDEYPLHRELKQGSGIFIPDNVFTVLIVKNAKEISNSVLWKCAMNMDL